MRLIEQKVIDRQREENIVTGKVVQISGDADALIALTDMGEICIYSRGKWYRVPDIPRRK